MLFALLGSLLATASAQVAGTDSTVVLDAREALRKRDRERLAATRTEALAAQHPLAQWVDYWELSNRLSEASPAEVDAFYARWPGTYVEDRLRNDWLLELGHRRDWANFVRDYPRFKMNDDREVSCYALLADHMAGRDIRDAARAAWIAQRDPGEGCMLLAGTLYEAKVFGEDDLWRATRLAVEYNRASTAKAIATLLGPKAATSVTELYDNPAHYLTRKASVLTPADSQLTALAIMRMASNDPEAAAGQLDQRWQYTLTPALASAAWAVVAKQAALKLMPEAVTYYERAWKAGLKGGRAPDWTDDAFAWSARAALRSGRGKDRWTKVLQAIDAMGQSDQREPTWVYWKARAQLALAPEGAEGDAARTAARERLASIAGPLSFYGALAAEDLGQPLALPPKPDQPSAPEREAARSHPGLTRALMLIGIGLRNEGVREWNYSLRGMDDRQLLAAAQLACEREVWDRCINTSERTRDIVDLAQRFPMPFREDVVSMAREVGIDPAYVYGLIRQESRFVMDARSSVGASGLMQVMPTTARWTARKLGLNFSPEMITDRNTNLRLGTGYLKLVLESFGGSQPMAAAAYNAGPNRLRRWREGPTLEAAVWAENIPFNETRDYVKKVLSNAAVYAALLTGQPSSVKVRLGSTIGPADMASPLPGSDLP
jgi:soluble lytic murein transglycosylase